MSVCVFLAADCSLPEIGPSKNYPVSFNSDTGKIFDGGADDNFSLISFGEAYLYCDKKYAVSIELQQFTAGRAARIIDYIKTALAQTESVEIWNVWLLEYWDYDDRPYISKKTIHIGELTAENIEIIYNASNLGMKDRNHPVFYCLKII